MIEDRRQRTDIGRQRTYEVGRRKGEGLLKKMNIFQIKLNSLSTYQLISLILITCILLQGFDYLWNNFLRPALVKPTGSRPSMTTAPKVAQQQTGIYLAAGVKYTVPHANGDCLSVFIFITNSYIDIRLGKQGVDQKAIADRGFG